jgi:hypothetical protein
MLPTLMTGTVNRTVGSGRNALRSRTISQIPSRIAVAIRIGNDGENASQSPSTLPS